MLTCIGGEGFATSTYCEIPRVVQLKTPLQQWLCQRFSVQNSHCNGPSEPFKTTPCHPNLGTVSWVTTPTNWGD